jgi:hypothetical protein
MGASTTQRVLLTGGTFAGTWAALGHGGLGGVIAAAVAFGVLENADAIMDKLGGKFSPRGSHDDDYPTEEEIAAYRRLKAELPTGEETVEAEDWDTNSSNSAGEPIFPKYQDNETLRIGQAIDREALAALTSAYQRDPKRRGKVAGYRFEPHINALFGKGAVFAAVQGSGKSMLNGLIIEQSGECDAPVIVLDHKGEYAPVTELGHLNGLIAGGPRAAKKAEQNGVPFFELNTRTADAFVEKVIVGHYQAIVLLPTYGDSWLARAEIVAEVGQALMRYSGRQRLLEKKVLPCLVFLDEAQLYLPQNVNLLPPEAQKNRDVLDNLSNAYFALVSNGRSNGYTMCFATQSLTYIAKWAIKSSQIRVIMRHVEVNDLDMCEKMINPAVATREEIESMPAGVGVVFGFTPKPMVVQFDTRESRDDSETPGIDRLRTSREIEPIARSTAKVSDLTLDELVSLLSQVRPVKTEHSDGPDTEKLPEDVTAQEEVLVEERIVLGKDSSTGRDVTLTREEFRIAVNMRKKKLSTGHRDLMDVFNLSEHHARVLNGLVRKELGLDVKGEREREAEREGE